MAGQAGFDYSKIKAYAGRRLDAEKLRESASGGAADALSEAIIAGGGAVFGAAYAPDFRSAEYLCAERREDLARLRGSKYIPAQPSALRKGERKSVYALTAEKLAEGKEVLFIGLGCTAGALRSYLSAREADASKLYVAELICMGPTSPKVAAAYIAGLEKRYGAKVTAFSVRWKKLGWTPPYIRAEFENGKTYETPFEPSDYGQAFNLYAAPACFRCPFKGANHKGDITLGDYWGIAKSDPAYHPDGVSLLITQTAQGERLLEKLDRKEFGLWEADAERALAGNPRYFTPREADARAEAFGRCLESDAFDLREALIKAKGRVGYWKSKAGYWKRRLLE